MKHKLFIIFLLSLFSYIANCKTSDDSIKEVVDYDLGDSKGYISTKSSKAIPFLSFLKTLESESKSFKGEFTMKIQSGEGLKDLNRLNGKIFYEEETGRMKVQLMETFFGLIVSQIISDENIIQIKSAGQEKIHEQPMGEIVMLDPSTKKKISIPFPIIYSTVRLNFSKVFESGETKVNPTDKKALVKKVDEEYIYSFYDKGLDSLEYKSEKKGFQAKSKVPDSAKDGSHPPKIIITRVTDLTSNKETSLVEIVYKNIQKNVKLNDSVFKF
jgi:outer membrane lipoprotein-sorting protein